MGPGTRSPLPGECVRAASTDLGEEVMLGRVHRPSSGPTRLSPSRDRSLHKLVHLRREGVNLGRQRHESRREVQQFLILPLLGLGHLPLVAGHDLPF